MELKNEIKIFFSLWKACNEIEKYSDNSDILIVKCISNQFKLDSY